MIKQLIRIVGSENVFENYSLKKCSSFGIGGNARFFVTPVTIDSLFNLINFAERELIQYKIVGNCTNILFEDNGFNGLIISTRKIDEIQVLDESKIIVSAGVSLAKVIALTKDKLLSGVEFAVGIPGSIGGAIVMNAGAGDGDMSKVVKSVTFIENGDIRTLNVESLEFGYRTSYFLKHINSIILFAELELTKVESEELISKKMANFYEKRRLTQPKEKSAGCVFKKCGVLPAGLIIDQVGLKGLMVGDAKVSEVHANFIVNTGNATAKDVKKLIQIIKSKVYEEKNLNLELEIEIVE